MRINTLLAILLLLFSSLAISAEVDRFAVPLGNSPQLGPADAPVTIIEFLDFQ